jgi:hypothetical protein
MENCIYKRTYNYNGCIYGVPQPIAVKIELNILVFVVEMNNETNQIEGIGLIKNQIGFDKYYKIYNSGDYNRYIYKSPYHIDRELILTYNKFLVEILDYILFKEKTHLKRGIGFTTVPEKLLNHTKCKNIDIKKEIKNIFIQQFKEVTIDSNPLLI